MTGSLSPRVAVIGAEAGRGWAALCVAAGWHVALYDADTGALQDAASAVADRAQRLVRLGRAEPEIVGNAVAALRPGRSLLHAVGDADWIIDATTDDATRARTLEQVEQVARLAAVITTDLGASTAGAGASEVAAAAVSRLRRPERVVVVRGTEPVELMPVVEVAPTPTAESSCVDDVRYWLIALGRVPVVLTREVPGQVLDRLAAAVWREAAALLLEGTIDPRDLDRALSLGLGTSWLAAAPLETAASGGEPTLLARLHALQALWPSLSSADALGPEDLQRLARQIERALPPRAGGPDPTLEDQRAERVARIVDAARTDPRQ